MLKELLIIGAGGFGREVLAYARDIKKFNPDCGWNISGFLDDNPNQLDGLNTFGFNIVGNIRTHQITDKNVYVMAIADSQIKKKISQKFISNGANFVNLIHPKAGLTSNMKIGFGNIICPYSCVSANVTFGNFITTNAFSTFGHDAVVEDFVTVSSHCDITGHAHLKEGCFLGSHAVICPNAVVGEYAKVGAGSVVLKKVKPYTTVFGIPAKTIS